MGIIRGGEAAIDGLDKKLAKEKTRFAYDHFKPRLEKATARQKVSIRKAMRLHVSKPYKDGSPKTIKQILEELSQAVAKWIADLVRESERKAQEIRAQMMEAERQRLAAHGGIPRPFGFSPSSSWGRAAQAQTAIAGTTPTSRHKP